MNQTLLKSMNTRTPITLIMNDPFETGQTYEVQGIVVDYSQKKQRVQMKSSSEVFWLPIEDIAEIREPSAEEGNTNA